MWTFTKGCFHEWGLLFVLFCIFLLFMFFNFLKTVQSFQIKFGTDVIWNLQMFLKFYASFQKNSLATPLLGVFHIFLWTLHGIKYVFIHSEIAIGRCTTKYLFYIIAEPIKIFLWKCSIFINPLMPGGKKRSHILKQTCSWKLQVCLNMSPFCYHQALKG